MRSGKNIIKQVRERELTDKELKRREEIADDLPDAEFKKRYGAAWKGIKMATATNMAKKEEVVKEAVRTRVIVFRYQNDKVTTGIVTKTFAGKTLDKVEYFLDNLFVGYDDAEKFIKKLKSKYPRRSYGTLSYPNVKQYFNKEFDNNKRDYRKEEVDLEEGTYQFKLKSEFKNAPIKDIEADMKDFGIKDAQVKSTGSGRIQVKSKENMTAVSTAVSHIVESNELEEADAHVLLDVERGDRDFENFVKKNRLKTKMSVRSVNPGIDELEITGDKRAIEKLLKLRGEDWLQWNPRRNWFEESNKLIAKSVQAITDDIKKEDHPNNKKKVKPGYHIMPDGTMMKDSEHKKESKDLEKELNDNVDETLDKIREANIQKSKSMKNILADIWKVKEEKELEEINKGYEMVRTKTGGYRLMKSPSNASRKFTKKDFAKNEDENLHTENGVEVVNMFGTSSEKNLMNQIAKNHDKRGSISPKEQKLRDAMVKKYYSKLESNDLEESKMGALFLDMQTDAQEMSLNDFIKKHRGQMGMSPDELKRMHKEFNEENKVEETEKDIYVEATSLAIAAAARALGEKPIDPADFDDFATDDDRKAADKNIIIQLRRAQDMGGKADVTFLDNPRKKIKIDIRIINKALEMFDKMRPNDKARMQSTISKSYKGLLDTVKRGRV